MTRTAVLALIAALVIGCDSNTLPEGQSPPPPPPPPPPPSDVVYWSDSATWAPGAAPTAGSDVTISAGTKMVLDVSPPPLSVVRIEGELRVSDSVDVELQAQQVMVAGLLEVGTEAVPHTGRFVLTLLSGDAPRTQAGTKFLLVLPGGALELHGQDRLGWTTLNATAEPGAQSLQLAQTHDWRPGDRIVVASSDFDPNHAEEAIVSGGAGKSVELGSPLKYRHWGMVQSIAGQSVDERAEVGLLSRNIVIRGDPSSENGFGGHVMSLPGASMKVEGVELYRMGQAGVLARYPLHWHVAGSVAGQYVRSNSIWHTMQRCVTVHGTDDALVANNVCYDHRGHGYFLEDGAESGNTFDHNLGLVARVPDPAQRLLDSDKTPATFWITNPDNVYTGNHAAGSVGFGFWYALPAAPTGLSTGEPDSPRYTPLGEFKDNVAHSNRRPGLQVDLGPKPDGTTETTSYRPRTGASSSGDPVIAVFDNFTGWKHTGRAVWLRGAEHRLRNAVLADNKIGATFASNETRIEDSFIVGETANVSDDPRPTFPIRGYEFYDGTVGASNVTFVNFVANGTRAASALGYNLTNAFNISTDNFEESIHLVNANAVWLEDPDPDKDGDKAALFRDLDGSITGAPGRAVVANSPLLLTSGCIWHPEWNSWSCPDKFVQLQVRGYDGAAVAPFTLSRDGTATTEFVGIPNNPASAGMSLIPDHDYRIDWSVAAPARVRFTIRRALPGDRVRIDFPWSSNATKVIRDYSSNSPLPLAASLAEAEAADGGAWYRDPGTGIATIVVMVRADRDYATVELLPQ